MNEENTKLPECPVCDKMAALSLSSIACQSQTDKKNKDACIALLIPLEEDAKGVDPIEVLAKVMELDEGHSIDETVERMNNLITQAADRAVSRKSALSMVT